MESIFAPHIFQGVGGIALHVMSKSIFEVPVVYALPRLIN
jgi:hypothetical protein